MQSISTGSRSHDTTFRALNRVSSPDRPDRAIPGVDVIGTGLSLIVSNHGEAELDYEGGQRQAPFQAAKSRSSEPGSGEV